MLTNTSQALNFKTILSMVCDEVGINTTWKWAFRNFLREWGEIYEKQIRIIMTSNKIMSWHGTEA